MDTRLTPRSTDRAAVPSTSIVAGSLWMIGIALVLFFLPLVNGLIGGLVGGYKVGTPGRALSAAILPAVVVAGGLWLLLALFDAPILGFAAGTAAGVLIVLADLGLVVGALIGGVLARKPVPPAYA